jgi:hypothetical protein
LVEERHGLHGFVRQDIGTSICEEHIIAPHRTSRKRIEAAEAQ